jgi:integrase
VRGAGKEARRKGQPPLPPHNYNLNVRSSVSYYMSMIYKHGQRYGLIPRNQESNPMRFVRCRTTSAYEAMILTPEQAYAVLVNLQEPERTLTLLASGTGLRISECLGLQWQDVSFANAMIHVRRIGRAVKSAQRRARRRKARCRSTTHCLQSLCFSGSIRRLIRNPVIGCFLPPG